MSEDSKDSFYKYFKNEEKELIKILTNYKMVYHDVLDFSSAVTFGTEIEYRLANYEKITYLIEKSFGYSLNKYSCWENTYDSSVCTIYKTLSKEIVLGGEVISPILTNQVKTWQELKKALDIIINANGIVDEHCGSHIHIGGNILENNEQYLKNLLLLWCRFEHIIYKYSYGFSNHMYRSIMQHEPLSNYIYNNYEGMKNKSFKEILEQLVRLSNISNPMDFLRLYQNNNINQVKRLQKNTIEFRIPNGTLNKYIWQNNINFFVHFIESAKKLDRKYLEFLLKNKSNYSLNEYEKIYFKDSLLLSELIFDRNIDKMMFMKQYMKIFQQEEKEYNRVKCLVK